MAQRAFLAAVLIACAVSSFAQATHSASELPVVISGEMPFYPPLARIGQVEGDVRLRVNTDGSGVTAVSIESGPPLLARAAEENVKGWKFKSHQPTSFSTLFSYHFREGNGHVLL